MLFRIAMLAIAAPRRIISIALFVTVAAAIFGVPVGKEPVRLRIRGSVVGVGRARQLLTDKFGRATCRW